MINARALLTTGSLWLLWGVTANADSPHAAGQAAFEANCAVCHQASGAGNPALAPPLLTYPGKYATQTQGRQQLLTTVLYGLWGEITVEGKPYNFKMPSFLNLDDETIAQALNYVVFGLSKAPNSVEAFSADDVAKARETSLTGSQVRAHRATLLQSLGL